MKLVSPILKHVAYPVLSSAGYFRRRAQHGELCVVTYHGVRPAGYVSQDAELDGSMVTAEAFRQQLKLLKANYSIVSPEAFFDSLNGGKPLPEKAVLLTCDDGVQNTVTDMLPLLQDAGVSCLFFITGGSLSEAPGMLWYEELKLLLREVPPGPIVIRENETQWTCPAGADRHAFWWSLARDISRRNAPARFAFLKYIRQSLGIDERWSDRYRRNQPDFRRFFLLSRKDLLNLQSQGMIIGAHTISHPLLSLISECCARREIAESRAGLEAALGRPVQAFAYPFGNSESVTARDLTLAESAGFSCAFLNMGGGFGAALPRFALPRVHVNAGMNLGEFEAHISGFYRRLRGSPAIPPAAASA
jgi:peptidoglycan/xylan/chitin deacetylase (PgdA/CDA1 family)